MPLIVTGTPGLPGIDDDRAGLRARRSRAREGGAKHNDNEANRRACIDRSSIGKFASLFSENAGGKRLTRGQNHSVTLIWACARSADCAQRSSPFGGLRNHCRRGNAAGSPCRASQEQSPQRTFRARYDALEQRRAELIGAARRAGRDARAQSRRTAARARCSTRRSAKPRWCSAPRSSKPPTG